MMNRKRFAWRGMNWLRDVPRETFWNSDARNARWRKHRQMQRLADVTGRVAPAVFMVVKIRTAGGKVQKCDSGQQGQRTTGVQFGGRAVHDSNSTSGIHLTVPG